jgi:hypothetical protein
MGVKKMKSYKIFEHPSGDVAAIKEEWSWTAFLFGWIWALCHGVWPLALALLALGMLVAGIAKAIGGEGEATLGAIALFGFLNSIVLGSIGNWLRARWQIRKGYACIGSVEAGSAAAALKIHAADAKFGARQADSLRG